MKDLKMTGTGVPTVYVSFDLSSADVHCSAVSHCIFPVKAI